MDHSAFVESMNNMRSSSGIYLHACMSIPYLCKYSKLGYVQSPVMIGALSIVRAFKRSVERLGEC